MKPSTFKLLALSIFGLFALASVSYGDTVYFDGAITVTDPTSHVSGQSNAGTGMEYYDLYMLAVDVTGTYTLELSSRNTTGTPSNALDTWVAFFANSFNPAAPGSPVNFSDDFTGTLTILPGPYAAQGYTSTATGFNGAQPSSRVSATLNAGTPYFIYVSSFRDTSYSSPDTSNGNATGPYVVGITGPGMIAVPEPSGAALLGLGALGAFGLGFWRRLKSA
jgi:hypothetical protein